MSDYEVALELSTLAVVQSLVSQFYELPWIARSRILAELTLDL